MVLLSTVAVPPETTKPLPCTLPLLPVTVLLTISTEPDPVA